MKRQIIFRADASVQIGGGHIMRCLALASALCDNDTKGIFVTNADAAQSVPDLAASGYDCVVCDSNNDKGFTDLLGAVDWVIIDGYQFDRPYEKWCRTWSKKVCVIDDFPDRRHDCDLLINQNIPTLDNHKVNGAMALFGPRYALLRREFSALRTKALKSRISKPHVPKRILVACGTMDPDNLTNQILNGIAASEVAVEVDVVLGLSAPHVNDVTDRLAMMPGKTRLHLSTTDMAGLMARADIGIGGAGITSWERCCLGLPSLIVQMADNQAAIYSELTTAEAGLPIGDLSTLSADRIAAGLKRLMRDSELYARISRNAASLCDGDGLSRVAEHFS